MDHLVFAALDLEEGVRHVERLTGARMSPGGRHHGFGSHNRLLRLGDDCYMEVVAIDPDQPAPEGPRWFGLDSLEEPRLVTWCAKSSDLAGLVAQGRDAGIDLGEPIAGGRERADGARLSWTFTDPWAERAGGVIPFFIDWGTSPHPAESMPAVCTFAGLRLEHPDPASVRTWLDALGLDTPVTAGHAARVIATLETPDGVVELV